MQPDLKTTILLCGILFGVVSVFMLSASTRKAASEGRVEWGLGYGGVFIGCLGVVFRGGPNDLLSIFFGNAPLLLGLAVFITGLARFVGRRAPGIYILAALATAANLFLAGSETSLRIVIFSSAIAILALYGAVAARPGPGSRDSNTLRGWLCASFLALSAAFALRVAAVGASNFADWSQAPAAEAILLTFGGTVFMVIALLLERLAAERRRSELDRALAAKELLFRELGHRTKNDILLVESLISLNASGPGGSLGPREIEDLRSRIHSVAMAHDSFAAVSRDGRVRLDEYLAAVLDSMPLAGKALNRELAPLEVPAEQTVPLGLLVNELVTNSVKHAFPAGEPASVRVSLSRDGNEAELVVSDAGSGTAWPPIRPGLGYAIVTGLASQVGGSLRSKTGPGTTLALRFPIA